MKGWMFIYCGNHFIIYVSQVIMLHTLNLHSAICQLYLNKTERKKITLFLQIFRVKKDRKNHLNQLGLSAVRKLDPGIQPRAQKVSEKPVR